MAESSVKRPTFGSLFAGIGGIDLGLERAGWTCAFQVEWDEWCQRVLAKHWPDVPRYGDITTVDWGTVEPVDLLAGGFPCQPFSLAGKRRGKADERWLWPEFARAIRALRPRYVLVENVPGLLAGHGGMGSVLGDLATLGYDARWDSIPAAAVGAPHLRYRIWIVAHAEVESERPGLRESRSRGIGRGRSGDGSGALADAARDGQRRARERVVDGGSGDGGPVGHHAQPEALADADLEGSQGHWRLDRERDSAGERAVGPGSRAIDRGWEPEPGLGGSTDGLSARLHEVGR